MNNIQQGMVYRKWLFNKKKRIINKKIINNNNKYRQYKGMIKGNGMVI